MRRNGRVDVLAWFVLLLAPAAVGAQPVTGSRCALLVGVQQYDKSELRHLKYSERDVSELAPILRKAGFDRVVLMTQSVGATEARYLPTVRNIRNELKGLLEDRTAADSILIALAGHGIQLKGDREHYFCPMDARLADRSTLVSLSDLYEELKVCKAGVRVLLVDACRNDPQADLSRDIPREQVESVTRPQTQQPPGGVAALFSCTEQEKSFESDKLRHGVFFHFVIQGLKGDADRDRDGQVDLLELTAFTQRSVPDRVKDEIGPLVKQKPQLVGEISGPVPLVRLRASGGPPSPTRTTIQPTRPPGGPGSRPGPRPPKGGPNPVVEIAGLTATAPDSWRRVAPQGTWLHEFELARAEGDKAEAEVVIDSLSRLSRFGDTKYLFDTWKRAFEPPPGKTLADVLQQETFEAGKLRVTQLDLTGTYVGRPRPGGVSGTLNKPDYRLLIARFEGGEEPFYVRLLGPSKTVATHKLAFDALLRSFRPQPAGGAPEPPRAEAPPPGVIKVAGLEATLPAGWKEIARPTPVVLPWTNISLSGEFPGAEINTIRVYDLARSTSSSRDRTEHLWKQNFVAPAGKQIEEVARLEKFLIGKIPVSYVDVSGSYLRSTRPGGPKSEVPNYRYLGATFDAPGGKVVIRLMGPEAFVARHKDAFDVWLKSFRPERP